jgi:hypothetical protein
MKINCMQPRPGGFCAKGGSENFAKIKIKVPPRDEAIALFKRDSAMNLQTDWNNSWTYGRCISACQEIRTIV